MASNFRPRVINFDDWRETTLFVIAGICGLSLLVVFGGLIYAIVSSNSEQIVSGPVTLSSEWTEFIPRKPLRPEKQWHNIVLDVDPTEGLVEDNLHDEHMQLANGVNLKPEIQLVDSQGNVFAMQVSRSAVPSRYNNGLIGYVSNLPEDRVYTKVRVRSNAPVRLSKIVWHCEQGK